MSGRLPAVGLGRGSLQIHHHCESFAFPPVDVNGGQVSFLAKVTTCPITSASCRFRSRSER